MTENNEPTAENIEAEETADAVTPAQDEAAPEAPAAETPAEETPAAEAPAEDVPAEEAPAEDAPAAEVPADEPAKDEPAKDEAAKSEDAPDAPAEEAPKPSLLSLAAGARYTATGKRKSAVARVILLPGKGEFAINGRTLEDYLPREVLRVTVRSPLERAGYLDKLDVVARVHGGGVSAQADALRHGIAKALVEAQPSLRGELKGLGFLTRDSRVKERKKAGLKKARKRPQFSKR